MCTSGITGSTVQEDRKLQVLCWVDMTFTMGKYTVIRSLILSQSTIQHHNNYSKPLQYAMFTLTFFWWWNWGSFLNIWECCTQFSFVVELNSVVRDIIYALILSVLFLLKAIEFIWFDTFSLGHSKSHRWILWSSQSRRKY